MPDKDPPLNYLDRSIIHKTYQLYVVLYACIARFPKKDRHSLGQKCDNSTLEILEYFFHAQSQQGSRRMAFLQRADIRLKILQTLIRVAYDIKALDQRSYISLQKDIIEIGKMLGGWIKSTHVKNSTHTEYGAE